MLRVLIVLTLASLAVSQNDDKPDFGLFTEEEIFYINYVAKTSWKATQNFQPHQYHDVKKLLGVKDIQKSSQMAKALPKMDHSDFKEDLPENFDARTQWSECPSLKEVRDQSDCGSCWAFGAVEAMTDRICIKSGGKKQVHISADNLLACCKDCGFGCQGGLPAVAWKYYQKTGLVSGGEHGSKQGCQPYPFPKCDHHVKGKYGPCSHTLYPTPPCVKKCRDGYNNTYKQDLHFGKSTYTVEGVENIMKELVQNGPVEAAFTVYADFPQYKSGVYRHTSGAALGGHAIKILGYGVEQGVKYWLVANSWNEEWGDKGFFKILRGSNECGIESGVVAGEPDL